MYKKATFVLAGALMLTAIIVIVSRPSLLGMGAETASREGAQAENSLVRAHSPVLGSEEAPVTVVEFFDPACEACRAFYPLTKRILEAYPEKVRLVVRYTPFHGDVSETAIRVLEVARMPSNRCWRRCWLGRASGRLMAVSMRKRSWRSPARPD